MKLKKKKSETEGGGDWQNWKTQISIQSTLGGGVLHQANGGSTPIPLTGGGVAELDLHKSGNELNLDLHKSGNELRLGLHKSSNELNLGLWSLVMN